MRDGEDRRARRDGHDCAFVLGGGGALGAHEVGMLQALFTAGITPDLVVGTSVGAINGAAVAADPTQGAVERLTDLWTGLGHAGVFSGSLANRFATVVRSGGTHLYSAEPLRRLLAEHLPVERIEDLRLPFQCVAAGIEGAAEHWFAEGPLADAVVASCSVPGLLPPAEIGERHYIDGGLVNSIPVGRAVALGARTVYVLQVGRIEAPLRPPRYPWQVAMVSFEIARRHRFARDMADLPDDVTVHVLPSGASAREWTPVNQLRHRDFARTAERIEQAYEASSRYLEGVADSAGAPAAPDSAPPVHEPRPRDADGADTTQAPGSARPSGPVQAPGPARSSGKAQPRGTARPFGPARGRRG
ncbi:patatin-like phospholipase family protein [Streptomyces sp. NBC_01497]|uniref:patatin-like phospholipase family protein n=1 Tax=Streptomyces sp. NBC_01497 TaxID=2903885 RepID=UPI002E336B1C|nr:patatin-like phospholipase family protein [Streptomyces sp. NBC_01497]